MPTPITMPSFGMYTAEGTLLSWLKAAGVHVEEGQPVIEIETEKATHEVPAPASGIVHPLLKAGAQLKEEVVIGYILAEGEKPPGQAEPQPASPAPATAPATSARPAAAATPPSVGGRIKASPIARRLAAEHGLDLAALKGSGPDGRIVEADVLAEAKRRPSAKPAAPTQFPWKIRGKTPLAGMRRAIGERLRHSVSTAVSLTLTREVEADRLVATRKRLGEKLGASVPYDAFFIKFLALGLREKPELNAIIDGDSLVTLDEVNIGFAVAVPGGLLVPVIRGADTAPVSAIGRSIRELTELARAGALKPGDVEGGTSTITNLGGFSVDAFTPILNPPQSSILGLGRIAPRPVVQDGALAVAQTCVLSLTFDHRVTDGAPAAQVLDAVARLMNDEAFLGALD